jgi:hypothetical protein
MSSGIDSKEGIDFSRLGIDSCVKNSSSELQYCKEE